MTSPVPSHDPHQPPPGAPVTTPTAAHVLMCTGPTCALRGARESFASVWIALEHERIAYYRSGGTVRLTESGCLGACDHGPTVYAYVRDVDDPSRMTDRVCVRMDAGATIALAREIHAAARVAR